MLSENERVNVLYYRKVASDYETTGRINEPGNKARIRRLLSSLIQDSNRRVLDVCCGAGLYLSILKDLVKPGNLYGLDLSPEMLKISGVHSSRVHLGSVYAIPFAASSFDLVTCSSALHHLDDLSRALAEISRVLKPEGTFLSDYDNNMYFAKFDTWKRRLGKALLVFPALAKVIGRARGNGRLVAKKMIDKPESFEELPLEELHRIAEAQNYHHDGIDGYRLVRMLRKAGFREAKVFTYHSARWNEGQGFNLFTSLSNNKIYSISRK